MKLLIKEVCVSKGVRVADLAKELKMTPRGINKIIQEGSTTLDTLERIATALNVQPFELIDNPLYTLGLNIIHKRYGTLIHDESTIIIDTMPNSEQSITLSARLSDIEQLDRSYSTMIRGGDTRTFNKHFTYFLCYMGDKVFCPNEQTVKKVFLSITEFDEDAIAYVVRDNQEIDNIDSRYKYPSFTSPDVYPIYQLKRDDYE